MEKSRLIKVIAFSLIVSMSVGLALTLIFYWQSKKPKGSTEKFDKKKLENYLLNLSKYYPNIKELINYSQRVINNKTNATFEELNSSCNSLKTPKERALCKAYLKLQKLQVNMYKPYLPLALIYYEHYDPFCFINQGLDKLKVAEFLKNVSICRGDKECINKTLQFIKNYQNYDIVKENVKIAYNLYKKGLLKCDKFNLSACKT